MLLVDGLQSDTEAPHTQTKDQQRGSHRARPGIYTPKKAKQPILLGGGGNDVTILLTRFIVNVYAYQTFPSIFSPFVRPVCQTR
jgi:hypothetical protein